MGRKRGGRRGRKGEEEGGRGKDIYMGREGVAERQRKSE